MNTTKKAYKEVLRVLNKYKSEIIFDVDRLELEAKDHLFGVDLVEEYGFDLDPKIINNTTYQKLKDNIAICFLDGEQNKIAWPDNGKQPNNETLLWIGFPSGPYIFGSDYPVEFFQKFFMELKTYNPKYVDSANKSLYFSMDNAGKIYNSYDSIIERYREENKKDAVQRHIEKTRKALAELEAQARE